MAAKSGKVKTYSELSKSQKLDVQKRMKPPYVGYLYKIYGRKVAYRFVDRPATITPDPLGLKGKLKVLKSKRPEPEKLLYR